MALHPNADASGSKSPSSHSTEFDILKASHKFLRDDDGEPHTSSWNDQLAQKYYSSLFREFAVCDLKHYKSGNFALRWRTEAEVLSGAGESTCGNTRCAHHDPPDRLEEPPKVLLNTLELPFAYEEHGQAKSALVKVVLCDRCSKKLMWKRSQGKQVEKRESKEKEKTEPELREGAGEKMRRGKKRDGVDGVGERDSRHGGRRRHSRSRSPRYKTDSNRAQAHRRRSKSPKS